MTAGAGPSGAPLGGRQPDAAYFAVMASVAQTHWWYRARRAVVAVLLADAVPSGSTALDVGCGTSETLDTLRALGAARAVGTDLSTDALAYAMGRRPRPAVCRSVAEHLPVADGCADVVVSMDVIEHLDDDVAALREYRRACRPGATVLLTVPAYPWLWGVHDDLAAHRRRYTEDTLRAAVTDAGFRVERTSYLFSFLVPLAALVRRTPLRRLVSGTEDEAAAGNPVLDGLFAALAWLERRLVARGVRVPFGLSVVCVARVP